MPGETIVDYLSGDENYSTFVELLEIAELEDSLMGEGPLTLFAPTNAAFDLMPQADLEDLREDPEALAALLNYHLVAEELTAEDLAEVGFVTTVEGSNVSVTPQAGTVTLNNNALVTESDIEAGNGIVHSINRVLTPPAS